jgi:hypothetical protein
MKNNLGYKANSSEVANLGATNDTTFNYFTLPVTVTSNDFATLDESLLTLPRQPDGSLPYIAFAQLVANSDLADKGTNINFAFAGAEPDLGAFEYALHLPPTLAIALSDSNLVFTGNGGYAGGTNYVISAPDLALPSALWTRVATNKFDVTGAFAVTNAIPAGVDRQFYRICLP